MLAPDTLLQNRYRIIRLINQGNMGAVYLAEDTRLGNEVALKETFFTSKDALLREQFHREARLLSRLHHTGLPRVTDHFIEESGQFLVMDFITGRDLKELLEEHGDPFPVDKVLDWASQLLDVLVYLHSQTEPVIHRDIKPANIKLTPKGKVILLDFGLAKGATSSLLMSLPAATMAYAPLEQVLAQGTDCRSDIYSLGATLYHLMTNRFPAVGVKRQESVWKGLPDPLPLVSDLNAQVPAAVARVLARAMALAADDRPQTAAEMGELLREATDVRISDDEKTAEPARLPDPPPDVYMSVKVVEDPETIPYQSPQPVEVKASVSPPLITSPEPMIDAQVPSSHHKESRRSARKMLLTVAGFLAIVAIVILAMWALKSNESGTARQGETPAAPPSESSDIVEDIGLEMAEIPGAAFLMGSPASEAGRSIHEGPQHQVTVSSFYMGKYEVTQAQWRAVATKLPKVKSDLNSDPSNFKGDDLPVEQVSWEEAMEFCERLSKAAGKTYRLPTEAEWEYACRARATGQYAGNLKEMAWYDSNSGGKTHSVGTKQPNGFGLYDMHGNVLEWCMDLLSFAYYSQRASDNPTGRGTRRDRVFRGGSWEDYALLCRSAFRNGAAPDLRHYALGFRLVRTYN